MMLWAIEKNTIKRDSILDIFPFVELLENTFADDSRWPKPNNFVTRCKQHLKFFVEEISNEHKKSDRLI